MSTSKEFRTMAPDKVASWVRWANGHDWGTGRKAHYDAAKGELVTYCIVIADNGEAMEDEGRSRTPGELRDWAGY